MKLTKGKVWGGGIVVAAIVVLALGRRRDEIALELLNGETGKPFKNLVITNAAVYRTPLAPIQFLPYAYRWRKSSSVVTSANGHISIPRISPRGWLHSQQLSFSVGELTTGPPLVYDTNGLWEYGLKASKESPIKVYFWQPLHRIELPTDERPVVIKFYPNKLP